MLQYSRFKLHVPHVFRVKLLEQQINADQSVNSTSGLSKIIRIAFPKLLNYVANY